MGKTGKAVIAGAAALFFAWLATRQASKPTSPPTSPPTPPPYPPLPISGPNPKPVPVSVGPGTSVVYIPQGSVLLAGPNFTWKQALDAVGPYGIDLLATIAALVPTSGANTPFSASMTLRVTSGRFVNWTINLFPPVGIYLVPQGFQISSSGAATPTSGSGPGQMNQPT